MPIKLQRGIPFVIALITATCTGTPMTATPDMVELIGPTKTTTPTMAPTSTPAVETWRELDLRFANVLDVSFERLNSTQVRFDVTLVHDDQGEAPNFADWWQVEDLTGVVLGQRILAHAHGTQPFTRSATIDVPVSIPSVVIRGHDMLHGFGGQVIVLDVVSGEKLLLADYPE